MKRNIFEKLFDPKKVEEIIRLSKEKVKENPELSEAEARIQVAEELKRIQSKKADKK
jgi:hypothetical protein